MDSPRQKLLEFVNEIPEENFNPSDEQILEWIGNKRLQNDEDLMMFKSNITSRSADFTDIIGEGDDSGKYAEIQNLLNYVSPSDCCVMTMNIGQSEDIKFKCTTILEIGHANKALMLRRNFYHSDHDVSKSDIISFDIPTYQKRRVIVDPSERVTYVMGIDYYGEQKMSLLRMAMEIMRRDKGGLGLHAGSKTYHLTDGTKKGTIIFGLSGTGKTTLTAHDHGKKEPIADVDILQDDIVLISEAGDVYGTEYGMYVKCADVPDHELITKAVRSKKPDFAVVENVAVDVDGSIDWNDYTHTHNSRAIVPRSNVEDAAKDIDLPKLDFILFNTRRPELPPIGRLISAAQGAAYYALGESIVTSAETKEPTIVGTAKRQIGFDPFILGEESLNINRIRKILEDNPETRCYVVNTGYVYEEVNNIGVEDTLACIEGILTNSIEWEFDEDLGYEVPKIIEGIEWSDFMPRKYYGEDTYSEIMNKLREERLSHLNSFENIDQEIKDAI